MTNFPSWKPRFSQNLEHDLKSKNEDALNFTFSTFGKKYPESRICVFRGFAGEIRSKGDHSSNPPAKSDLLVFTTDSKMPKYEEIKQNPNFTAVFWFSKSAVQYRFYGKAHLIKEDTEDLLAHFHVEDGKKWSWKEERLRQWNKLPAWIRGSMAVPWIPGEKANGRTPDLIELKDSEAKAPSEKLLEEEGLNRFHLVVMEIEKVDELHSQPAPGRRRKWFITEGKDWEEIACMP
ncbi:hypothetical protein NEOLI_002384 [Neolecta irregularis DAH-3]|uniref:Pyridoxamine 5'-phosphate oxidase Alr4036 family FMN-binding domain-containing protein n=1 Tax=Neolecta irregularis (strain DAH-3) TaxID=1198029 RepID=A0A1U7LU84_NEOID|nr:hypothetical protein NEOLI_002384 [Neolecta irregularis DAH-3]|eukprot:OLL26236.1 hypothetical protein NEOLI_002384 [Neolecta irregularis DAH-3]